MIHSPHYTVLIKTRDHKKKSGRSCIRGNQSSGKGERRSLQKETLWWGVSQKYRVAPLPLS